MDEHAIFIIEHDNVIVFQAIAHGMESALNKPFGEPQAGALADCSALAAMLLPRFHKHRSAEYRPTLRVIAKLKLRLRKQSIMKSLDRIFVLTVGAMLAYPAVPRLQSNGCAALGQLMEYNLTGSGPGEGGYKRRQKLMIRVNEQLRAPFGPMSDKQIDIRLSTIEDSTVIFVVLRAMTEHSETPAGTKRNACLALAQYASPIHQEMKEYSDAAKRDYNDDNDYDNVFRMPHRISERDFLGSMIQTMRMDCPHSPDLQLNGIAALTVYYANRWDDSSTNDEGEYEYITRPMISWEPVELVLAAMRTHTV